MMKMQSGASISPNVIVKRDLIDLQIGVSAGDSDDSSNNNVVAATEQALSGSEVKTEVGTAIDDTLQLDSTFSSKKVEVATAGAVNVLINPDIIVKRDSILANLGISAGSSDSSSSKTSVVASDQLSSGLDISQNAEVNVEIGTATEGGTTLEVGSKSTLVKRGSMIGAIQEENLFEVNEANRQRGFPLLSIPVLGLSSSMSLNSPSSPSFLTKAKDLLAIASQRIAALMPGVYSKSHVPKALASGKEMVGEVSGSLVQSAWETLQRKIQEHPYYFFATTAAATAATASVCYYFYQKRQASSQASASVNECTGVMVDPSRARVV